MILLFFAAESLQDALKQLFLIDALDENGTITPVGKTMAGIHFFLPLKLYYIRRVELKQYIEKGIYVLPFQIIISES